MATPKKTVAEQLNDMKEQIVTTKPKAVRKPRVKKTEPVVETPVVEPKVHRVMKKKDEPVLPPSQITGTAFFDLKDYISSIKSLDVGSQMAQSVAFAIDMQLTAAVRLMFNNAKKNFEMYGYDSIGDMVKEMEGEAFAEEVMIDAGVADIGPVQTILQLKAIRESWHTLAGDLTGMTLDWKGSPREYEWQTVEQMLLREVKMQIKPKTEHRIKISVKNNAIDLGMTDEEIEHQVKRRIEREKDHLRQVSETLTMQQAAMVTCYEQIEKVVAHRKSMHIKMDVHFHQLDTKLRLAMLQAAIRGASRAEEFATRSNIDDFTFDEISLNAVRATRDLSKIMRGPGYEVNHAMALV